MMNNHATLRLTIAADAHLDICHSTPRFPMDQLCYTLADTKALQADAVVLVGDITSHGIRENWDLARACFEEVPHCADHILLATGNHDFWCDAADEYASAYAAYTAACRDITGQTPDKPYFAATINGYRLLCLGNESDKGCDADISDSQLAWLETELTKATAAGKPAFVFCHQSLNGRHGLPRTWEEEEDPTLPPEEGGVGASSEKLEKILKSFPHVFYFSGHSHMGLCGEKTLAEQGYASFEEEDGLSLINLPSLACGNHCGELNAFATGVVLEVYEDRVVITPRDFAGQQNITAVPLRDGKPYYEVKLH